MNTLNYPFSPEEIIKKKKSYKKQLLSDPTVNFLEKKIAILGGETTQDIKLILELFLLNYGIKPSFYESEYNRYYEDGMFPNKELEGIDDALRRTEMFFNNHWIRSLRSDFHFLSIS